MSRILVTGANGQIGSELVEVLRERHGPSQVVRLDLKPPPAANGRPSSPPFEVADVRNRDALADVIAHHEIEEIYHLASLLSATGEQHPDRAWDVNMTGLKHVLDLACEHDLQVFWPSSIAVFGPFMSFAPRPYSFPSSTTGSHGSFVQTLSSSAVTSTTSE